MGYQLTHKEVEEILKSGTYLNISVINKKGDPEIYSLVYIYDEDAIYIHGSKHSRVFLDLDYEQEFAANIVTNILVDKQNFTMNYECVTITGGATKVDTSKREKYMRMVCGKYLNEYSSELFHKIFSEEINELVVYRLPCKKIFGRGHNARDVDLNSKKYLSK